MPRPLTRGLPHSSAALAGWKRMEPGASRPPAPRESVVLVAYWLCDHNQSLLAFMILLMFEMYMRPSEAAALRQFQLVGPVTEGRGAAGRWAILIRAAELGQLGGAAVERELAD